MPSLRRRNRKLNRLLHLTSKFQTDPLLTFELVDKGVSLV